MGTARPLKWDEREILQFLAPLAVWVLSPQSRLDNVV